MTPEQLAKSGTEHGHQAALFCWRALNVGTYPELEWFHAIKNEEKSGSVILGSRAKAAGIKKGVSDCFLPVRRGSCSGLYIEMKKPGGKESTAQVEFGQFVMSQGFGYICCDHWEKARDTLILYLQHK